MSEHWIYPLTMEIAMHKNYNELVSNYIELVRCLRLMQHEVKLHCYENFNTVTRNLIPDITYRDLKQLFDKPDLFVGNTPIHPNATTNIFAAKGLEMHLKHEKSVLDSQDACDDACVKTYDEVCSLVSQIYEIHAQAIQAFAVYPEPSEL